MTPRRPPVDVTRLPADVVALIDTLGPDEELVITRDGDPIATISGTLDFSAPDRATEQLAYDNMTVVATAMKLSAALGRLRQSRTTTSASATAVRSGAWRPFGHPA